MTLAAESAYRILNEAAQAEVGIQIEVRAPVGVVTPVLRAKQVLYRFKQDNALWKDILIKLSPEDPDHRLWLIKMPPRATGPDSNVVDIDL